MPSHERLEMRSIPDVIDHDQNLPICQQLYGVGARCIKTCKAGHFTAQNIDQVLDTSCTIPYIPEGHIEYAVVERL